MRAIKKAAGNGWIDKVNYYHSDLMYALAINTNGYYSDIFSHDFAKALFGKKDMWDKADCTCGGVDFHFGGPDMHYKKCVKLKAPRGYKFHLAKMVVEKDPLKYLTKFL